MLFIITLILQKQDEKKRRYFVFAKVKIVIKCDGEFPIVNVISCSNKMRHNFEMIFILTFLQVASSSIIDIVSANSARDLGRNK